MLKNPSNTSVIFNALIGTSISSLALTILTFISGVLLARALGPEARGVYGGTLLIAQTIVTITILSFPDGAIVTLRKIEDNKQAFFNTIIMIACSLAVMMMPLLIIVGPILADYANSESVSFFIFFSGALVFTTALSSSFSSYERSNMKFKLTNILRVAAPLLFSVALIWLMMFKREAITAQLILVVFLITKIPMLAAWVWAYRSLFYADFNFKFALLSIKAGLHLHPAVVIGVIAASFDRLVALSVWDATTLGLYFVAFSAVGVGFGLVVTAMRTVLFPFLSGLLDIERTIEITRSVRLTIVVSCISAVCGFFLIPFLIPLIYGREFADAAELARMLIFAMCTTPLHAIVLEAGRSLGRGMASAEMALVSLMTMIAGYLLTGYDEPFQIITALAVSNVLAIMVGSRHLLKNGDIRLDDSLVPKIHDLQILQKAIKGLFK